MQNPKSENRNPKMGNLRSLRGVDVAQVSDTTGAEQNYCRRLQNKKTSTK